MHTIKQRMANMERDIKTNNNRTSFIASNVSHFDQVHPLSYRPKKYIAYFVYLKTLYRRTD